MKLVLLLFIALIHSKNYAILVNPSIGYQDYRHMANVYTMQHILTRNGFKENEIITLFYDNQIEDVRNIEPGHVKLSDSVTVPYVKLKKEKNAFFTFLNALEGNHKKIKDMDETSNLLIYLCGHGNESFLKFGHIYYTTKDEIINRVLKLARKVNKIMLIVDTCQAEELSGRNILPENVYILSTSVVNEPSISSFVSNEMAVNLVDNFVYYFFKKIIDLENTKVKISDVLESLEAKKVASTLTYTKNDDTIYDFFVQNDEEQPIRPFNI